MFAVIWMFHVPIDREAAFVRAYGSGGDWAVLFQRDKNHLGSELLRDAANPRRFVTIDKWTSSAAYEAFLDRWRPEYEALDRVCDQLTEQEMKVGEYVTPE